MMVTVVPPISSPLSVSVQPIRAAFAAAVARGQDQQALCDRFGLSPAQLTDPEGRVPVELTIRIWTELPELTGTNDSGLAVAENLQRHGAMTVLAYLQRSAPTLGEGLRAIQRYRTIIQDATELVWSVAGDVALLELRPVDPAFALPRHYIEYAIAWVLLTARKATGKHIRPRWMSFRHEQPTDDSEPRRVFDCELRYNAAADVVAVELADLAVPQITSDPELSILLERQANAIEAQTPKVETSFSARVRQALMHELAQGSPSLATIAQRLGVSPRTAQRQLHREGTSLQEIYEQLRRDLAVKYLDETTISVQEIAMLLGFSHHSAFYHAFVRWFGTPPTTYRQRPR